MKIQQLRAHDFKEEEQEGQQEAKKKKTDQ